MPAVRASSAGPGRPSRSPRRLRPAAEPAAAAQTSATGAAQQQQVTQVTQQVTQQVTLQVTQQVTLPRPTRATNRLIIDASHEGQIFTDLPFFMGIQIK